MTLQLILNLDNKTFEMANTFAKIKGLSVNNLFENYIRLILLNDININSSFQLEISENKAFSLQKKSINHLFGKWNETEDTQKTIKNIKRHRKFSRKIVSF